MKLRLNDPGSWQAPSWLGRLLSWFGKRQRLRKIRREYSPLSDGTDEGNSRRFKLRFRAPGFWHRPSSRLGKLLSPLGTLYGAASTVLQTQTVPFRANLPVLCVGNVTLGGAGKTPATIALTAILQDLGEKPHLLSRGFGAAIASPVRVDLSRHTAKEVGDEPMLLARYAPTWVHPSRAASAKLAMIDDATVLLLDDGLQHGAIQRDTAFLVIDTDYGLGNGYICPAGPLRETLEAALHKSQAIIALGKAPLRLPVAYTLPVFRALTRPTAAWESLRDRPVFAFAGLANNSKFFRMCESMGMHILDRESYPDHYDYTRAEVRLLIHRANLLGATVVTTEKDAVKLHPDERAQVHVLPIELVWEDKGAITRFVADALTKFRSAPPTLSF